MVSELQRQVTEALQPAATVLANDMLFWASSEKAPAVYYVRFFGELACKINVRRAHDLKLIRTFLEELSSDQIRSVTDERPLGFFESRALAATPFHLRAVAHPSISQGTLSKATGFMADLTYTTFPVYRCEFTNDDTPDEAVFRMAKVVPWSNWDRPPSPAISARFHRTRTGIKSTGGKRMGIFSLPEIERIISFLAADDGFIEVENYERNLVRIEHAEDRYVVVQGDDHWTPRHDMVIPWLRVYGIEGLNTANSVRGNYVA
jgi:hypothetical protein